MGSGDDVIRGPADSIHPSFYISPIFSPSSILPLPPLIGPSFLTFAKVCIL
jgi:hypothetical protein